MEIYIADTTMCSILKYWIFSLLLPTFAHLESLSEFISTPPPPNLSHPVFLFGR